MGQQQSADKGDNPEKSSRKSTAQSDKDKGVSRRRSIQILTGRSTPADPSATIASSNAPAISQPTPRGDLREQLQTVSPELSATRRVDRSSSRGSRASKQGPNESPMPLNVVPPAGPSEPMNVPTSANRSRHGTYDDRSAFQNPSFPSAPLHKPPRLPLAIVETVPESPVLRPVDEPGSIHQLEPPTQPLDAMSLTDFQNHSTQSMGTEEAEGEEEDIKDMLKPLASEEESPKEAIPTKLEWNHHAHGEKVYVTGSFVEWLRKYRMYEKRDGTGFATIIALPPGTHHIMFFLGQSPKINPDIPTTVDINNVLVNYIEVVPEDVARGRRESSHRDRKPAGAVTPQMEDTEPLASGAVTPDEPEEPEEPFEEELPQGDFRQITPQSLVDIDLAEDDPRYHQALQVIQETAAPPLLPMFLAKSILNGTMPMKDDASVLGMPNHTVLNHLATSAVRSGVLATSVTSRYKKKVCCPLINPPRNVANNLPVCDDDHVQTSTQGQPTNLVTMELLRLALVLDGFISGLVLHKDTQWASRRL